mmetsp:Transcript_54448/g.126756  ORF Transcript_54448/g.126756 Transcript_54448/m.126756 type:complete len:236 (+) Transcript_54448:192-899(+)
MGQGLDVLKTCDGCQDAAGAYGADSRSSAGGTSRQGGRGSTWDEDAAVGCAALEDGVKQAVATANRGGARISDEVLLNHELLQYARQGNVKGVSAALDKGAWTETRRPLVMKPQKPEALPKGAQGGGSIKEDKDPASVGMTALMFSAQNGSAECIRRLLWAGAEVNAIEEDGWTALHFAAKEGHLDVCTTLLQSRADPHLVNADDMTPLQVAEEGEDDEFAHKFKAALNRGKPRS